MSPTPIDRMLSRALLVPDPDFLPENVLSEDIFDDPAGADPFHPGLQETLTALAAVDDIINEQSGSEVDPQSPAAVLNELCEIAVSQGALDLADWITERVPGPAAARVLGCVLQLAGATFDARLWWQYAAGDDRLASYCLYLHHLSVGEKATAASWLAQFKPQPAAEPRRGPAASRTARKLLAEDADASLHTLLRVLRGLRAAGALGCGYDQAAVVGFVPATLADCLELVDDWILPLPRPHFADQVVALLAVAGARTHPLPVAGAAPSAEVRVDDSVVPRRLPGAHLDVAQKVEAPAVAAEVDVELTPPTCVSPIAG